MRFSSAFVAAAALYLAPFAVAADEPDVDRPNFSATNLKAPFLEQFTDDWETRWKASHAKKVQDQTDSEEEWAYVGTWAVEEPTVIKGINGDKGLVLKDQAAHHAISAIFPEKIDNKGKTLVVQYEVKAQEELSCAGAYMKLLQENKALHQDEFSNASPYIIMFGPDKCGSTNKIHFIVRHKNPISGEYEEKHLIDTPYVTIDNLSHLYTLIVKPDDTFEIKVDGKSERNGTFADDFSPEFTPAKEIDDASDKKPSDWVDEAKIKDPEAAKPDDWDEDAPAEIVDEEAEKPDDWLEDEPEMIRDPEVEKPEDWNDEEDGDWEAPLVPNPKCQDVSGCGPWTKPMKKNPAYKGKWSAPLIDNPLYKGVWKPKKIANPNHFEAKEISNLEPMGAIGFELWSMNADILFDNIYIGHSVDDAEKLKKETYDVKAEIEKKIEELTKPKEETPDKAATDVTFKEDPVSYIKQKLDLFITMAKADPVEAVKFLPEVAGGLGLVVVTALALILGGLGVGAKSPQVQDAAAKAKAKAGEAKDKTVDAAQAAKDKAQAEVNKRQTRSTGSDN